VVPNDLHHCIPSAGCVQRVTAENHRCENVVDEAGCRGTGVRVPRPVMWSCNDPVTPR
jgi:hypothetical protein